MLSASSGYLIQERRLFHGFMCTALLTTGGREQQPPQGKKDTAMRTPLQLVVLLSFLTLAACSTSSGTGQASSSTPTPTHQPTSPTPSVPSIDCPARGEARAAVLSSFSAGTDQNV